jgi:hypothetical protein
MAQIADLDIAIKKVCPIHGVSGDIADLSRIRIDFKDEATREQRDAAREVLRTFDASAPGVVEIHEAICDKLKEIANNPKVPSQAVLDLQRALISDDPTVKQTFLDQAIAAQEAVNP